MHVARMQAITPWQQLASIKGKVQGSCRAISPNNPNP